MLRNRSTRPPGSLVPEPLTKPRKVCRILGPIFGDGGHPRRSVVGEVVTKQKQRQAAGRRDRVQTRVLDGTHDTHSPCCLPEPSSSFVSRAIIDGCPDS
nr:hypothetical protein CFP56_64132 [Quercus suber]